MTDEAKPVATERARCHPPDPPEAIPSLSRRGWRGRVRRAGRHLWPDHFRGIENGAMMLIPGNHQSPVYDYHGRDDRFCGAIDPMCCVSTSGAHCRVSARPARSPCTMCVPCTSRRPISPALSAACCCSSTARPTPGRRSALLAGSRNSTTCCSAAAQP